MFLFTFYWKGNFGIKTVLKTNTECFRNNCASLFVIKKRKFVILHNFKKNVISFANLFNLSNNDIVYLCILLYFIHFLFKDRFFLLLFSWEDFQLQLLRSLSCNLMTIPIRFTDSLIQMCFLVSSKYLRI